MSIYSEIDAIRQTDAVNMYDIDAVIEEADSKGKTELRDYLKLAVRRQRCRAYLMYLLTGEKMIGKEED